MTKKTVFEIIADEYDIGALNTALSALGEKHRRDNANYHPSGYTDRAGRWYPDNEEKQPCCASIRSPSAAWKWSLYKHCHSLGHIAMLHDADEELAKTLSRVLQKLNVTADKMAKVEYKTFREFETQLALERLIAA